MLGPVHHFEDLLFLRAAVSLWLLLQPVFFILHAAFFGLHYLFASQTAHIGALYAAFLAMMLASGKHQGLTC